MESKNILGNIKWQGNSRQMYEAILDEVPFIFVGGVKKNIADWIEKNKITVVTEDVVFKAVDDIASPSIANGRIKPALEKLRSN